MKPRLQVFSITKMVARHIPVLISLLFFVLYNIVDGCVNTPWTGMCEVRCYSSGTALSLRDCNTTTLGPRSLSGGGEDIKLTLDEWSGITKVSSRAFSGYTVDTLHLREIFKMFEDEAFANLTVRLLLIKDNPQLTSLPSGVFRGIKGLKDLTLTHNDLQSLHADTFHELTGLRALYLSFNNLTSLPASIFHELTGLEQLNINHNKLSSLPASIFRRLDKLTKLHIHSNFIRCFSLGLFQPLPSLINVNVDQKVNIEGLCARTFRLTPGNIRGLNNVDECIRGCGAKFPTPEDCDCDSYEGCIDCSTGEAIVMTTGNEVTTMEVTTDNEVTTMEKPTVVTAVTADNRVTTVEKPTLVTAVTTDNRGTTPSKQPLPTTGGVSRMKSASWKMAFIFYQVLLKIRQFDF